MLAGNLHRLAFVLLRVIRVVNNLLGLRGGGGVGFTAFAGSVESVGLLVKRGCTLLQGVTVLQILRQL